MASAPPYAPPYPPTYPPRRRSRVRWVFIGLGVAIVVAGLLLLLISFSPSTFGLSRTYVFPYGGGFFGVFLLLWGTLLLVRVAFWAARRGSYGGGPNRRRFDPAVMEARQRYARGEISREQFEQIVTDLRRPPPGPLP